MQIFFIGLAVTIVAFAVLGYNQDLKAWKPNPKQWISVIGVVVMAFSFVKSVPTGHTGIVTIFGKVQNYTLDAGIHVLAPWKEVVNMDNRIQKVTVDMGGTTSDMQDVDVTFTLNYQISKKNASEIYRTIGTEYENTVISAQITNTVKAVIAKYEATKLIEQRTEVSNTTNTELEKVLAKYNIEVVDTAIENMEFSATFNDSIEAKVVAQQQLEQAKTEQEKVNLETENAAKRKITEAQGIADANKIINDSITQNVLTQQMIDKWNGELPKAVGENTPIFDISSMMNGNNAAQAGQ